MNPTTSEGVLVRRGGIEDQAMTKRLTSHSEYAWQTVPSPWILRSTLYHVHLSKGEQGQELASSSQLLKVPVVVDKQPRCFLKEEIGSELPFPPLAYDGIEPLSNGITVVFYGALGVQPPVPSTM